MKQYLLYTTCFLLLAGCNQNADRKNETKNDTVVSMQMYSRSVADSFSISVSLPDSYNRNRKYPVVYLLDANLYFDIMATTFKKYAPAGLAPEIILVGIGYKDFQVMDSLRNRDDTYPKAIPEYEMSVSGGGDKFLSFINTELIPFIDKQYATDTSKRVLMGHSLGGYFTTYALLENLLRKNNSFSSYIAASPSIFYNHYYLLNQLKGLPQENCSKKTKVYITFRGLEDSEEQEDSSMMKTVVLSEALSTVLSGKQAGCIVYKGDIFSNLSHMDTQIPTFIKGLQWALNEEQLSK